MTYGDILMFCPLTCHLTCLIFIAGSELFYYLLPIIVFFICVGAVLFTNSFVIVYIWLSLPDQRKFYGVFFQYYWWFDQMMLWTEDNGFDLAFSTDLRLNFPEHYCFQPFIPVFRLEALQASHGPTNDLLRLTLML